MFVCLRSYKPSSKHITADAEQKKRSKGRRSERSLRAVAGRTQHFLIAAAAAWENTGSLYQNKNFAPLSVSKVASRSICQNNTAGASWRERKVTPPEFTVFPTDGADATKGRREYNCKLADEYAFGSTNVESGLHTQPFWQAFKSLLLVTRSLLSPQVSPPPLSCSLELGEDVEAQTQSTDWNFEIVRQDTYKISWWLDDSFDFGLLTVG